MAYTNISVQRKTYSFKSIGSKEFCPIKRTCIVEPPTPNDKAIIVLEVVLPDGELADVGIGEDLWNLINSGIEGAKKYWTQNPI